MFDPTQKFYFYFNAKINECKIVESNIISNNNSTEIENNESLHLNESTKSNDYIIEIPLELKKHIFKDKISGVNNQFSVLEEHYLYSFILNSLNLSKQEDRIISKLYLALILNSLGYHKSTITHLNYVIKSLGKENKQFKRFLVKLKNIIPKYIPKNFTIRITIVTAFKESEIEYVNLRNFGQVII